MLMEDDKMLADYGLSSSLAKAQSPAEVGLSFMNDGTFEVSNTGVHGGASGHDGVGVQVLPDVNV